MRMDKTSTCRRKVGAVQACGRCREELLGRKADGRLVAERGKELQFASAAVLNRCRDGWLVRKSDIGTYAWGQYAAGHAST